MSDKLCAKLVKQLGYAVDTPWRLHHDHKVFGCGRRAVGDLQACPRELRRRA